MDRPVTSTTTTLPSGLERVEAVSRTVSFPGPLGPFDYNSETTVRDINGKRWTERYTKSTRTRVLESPESRELTTVEDDFGRVISRTRTGILPVTFSYDSQGRLETIQQGTRTTTNAYFNMGGIQNGYLQGVTNPEAETTSFVRDAVGRTLTETYQDANQTQFSWDDNGNLSLVQPPGKPAHTQFFNTVNQLQDYTPPTLIDVSAPATSYSYNLDRQVTLEQRPGAVNIQTDYDTAGRVDLLTLPTGTVDYEYYPVAPCPTCAPGRLMSLTGPDPVTVNLEYDGALLTKTSWAGDVTGDVAWTYDNDFRPIAETVSDGTASTTAHFGYDEDNLVTCASATGCSPVAADAMQLTYNDAGLLTGATMGTLAETYTYNAHGELATHTVTQAGAPIYDITYDSAAAPRDQLGRIKVKSETVLGTSKDTEYSYDERGRLITVAEDSTVAEDYAYDANGNRLSLTTPTDTFTGTYDDQDRLITYGDNSYTYGPNGELESKTNTVNSETTHYVYDARGSLLSVTLPDTTSIEYTIDGQARRVGKSVNGVTTQQFLYNDELRISAELNGDGEMVSRFTYVGASHSPDYITKGNDVYRVVKDQVGSPRLIVNIVDGMIVQALAYDEFGVVTTDSNPGFQPFGFAGGLYDRDSGLLRFGARDYEPGIGRWTLKDPVRWEGDQENLYVYSLGDPSNQRDPSGLASEEDCPRSATCGASNCFLSDFSDDPCPTCPDIVVDGWCTYLCSNGRGDTNGTAIVLLYSWGGQSDPICDIDDSLTCEP